MPVLVKQIIWHCHSYLPLNHLCNNCKEIKFTQVNMYFLWVMSRYLWVNSVILDVITCTYQCLHLFYNYTHVCVCENTSNLCVYIHVFILADKCTSSHIVIILKKVKCINIIPNIIKQTVPKQMKCFLYICCTCNQIAISWTDLADKFSCETVNSNIMALCQN